MSRKLATVRRIDAIDPIPGADAIEVANVSSQNHPTQRKEGLDPGCKVPTRFKAFDLTTLGPLSSTVIDESLRRPWALDTM